MPGAGLSAKGAMLAPPRGAGQQEPFRAPCPQREFAVSRVSPLAGGGGSLCPPPPQERTGRGTRLRVGEPGGCRLPGPASGLLLALPRSAAPGPCRAPGGSTGRERGLQIGTTWKHICN